jgi:hypothetical protein
MSTESKNTWNVIAVFAIFATLLIVILKAIDAI